MSTLSTPTRLGRGLVVPGIDTKSPLDKSNSIVSYGGLHTPPQSAHESRRPSLQYAGPSEGPYSAASYTQSQPVTPIHGLNHTVDVFSQAWSQSVNAQEACSTTVPEYCSTSPIADQPFTNAFESNVSYHSSMLANAPVYTHLSHASSADALPLQPSSCSPTADSWRQSHGIPSYAAHNACLGPTLFPIPHGMNLPPSNPGSVFDHLSQPSHSFSYHVAPDTNPCVPQACGTATSMFHNPQVVVPSQLSPQEDYSDQNVPSYTTPDRMRSHEEFNSSFSSGVMSFNGYEMVEPPSPQDVYFAHSEDEDFLMIKDEAKSIPAHEASSSIQELPTRPRRRVARRPRKAGNRRMWCQHDVNGCVVQCEGRQCVLEPLKFEVASNKKAYQCKFVEENGRKCGARFDRSEHLKRHEGSHLGSSERKYPCPLPSCGRRIGRPDNAGDHFKTHLRPNKSGKRNAHFDWHDVQDAIWDNYEDKKAAKKLLDGLRRWINAGMPDTPGSKRGMRS